MKGMERLAYRLSLSTVSSPDLIDFQLLIGTHQNHLCATHRKAVARFQALAQYLTFFFH
jgi:hypothetical protein